MALAQDTAKHKEMLYPVVRVTVGSGGGSGTLLYSEDRGDGCQTFVLTNHHVIDGAIHVAKAWSSLLQADRKREANDLVQVEIFRYAAGSRQDMADSCRAEIVAHNKDHDLALLKLQTARTFDHVAALLPDDAAVEVFDPCWAVGCSLLHPPISTSGHISYLDDVIDRKKYWMSDAQIIFGNSGGAMFVQHDKHYVFVGVPSRVAGTWGQVIPHMGWFVPVTRIREWLAEEQLMFLLDDKSTPAECFAKRGEMQKRAEMQLKAGHEGTN